MTQKQTFARYPGYVAFALANDPSERAGWDILDIITGDHVESRYEAIGVAQGYHNNGYGSPASVMEGPRYHVVRRSQFLMGRKEADVVGELRSALATAKEQASAAQKKVEGLEKQAQALELDVKVIQAQLKRADDETESTRSASRKLEADMAKLKRVLGERAVQDALG